MSERIAKAVLEFGVETQEFFADLERVSGALGQKISAAGTSLKTFGREATDAGRALSVGITAPIVGLGAAAVKSAIDFESSFAGVRKTVNATEGEFASLSAGFREMAKTIPVNVNELNKIGEAAGQLGIKKENILGFTRVMADLGVATNLSSDEAATALARLANITGMSQGDFDRLGSTIVSLGNNFATTEAEIVAMGLRIAGAGNQIGLSEAQILGVAAALSSVGIEAEAGGSAISKVMIDMAATVEKGGEKLDLFSKIAGVDFATAFKADAAGALTTFIKGLADTERHGMSTLGALEALEITEVRMRDALLRASGAGDLMNNTLQVGVQGWTENTALTKEAEQRYATLASRLTILWNKLTDVAVAIGTALMPTINALIDKSDPLIARLAGVASWFTNLPQPVQLTALAIAGVAAAAGPVLLVVGAMATGLAALAPWFAAGTVGATVLGGALTLLAGPVGLAVAAIAGLALVWATWGDDITRVVSSTFTAIKTWLWDRLEPVLRPIGGLLTSIGSFFQAFGLLVGAVAELVARKLGEMVTGAIGWLVDRLSPVFAPLREAFESIATKVGDVMRRVVDFARQTFEGVKSWLLDKFVAVVDGIRKKIDAVTEAFRVMYDKVVGNSFVPDMIAAIARHFGLLEGNMVAPTALATSKTSGLFEQLHTKVSSLMDGLSESLTTKLSGMFGGGGLMQSIVGTGMSAVFGPVSGLISSLAQKGMEALGNLVSAGLKKIGGFFKTMFGGPSAEELAGREVVSNFERNVQSMLTEAQKVEAGNDSWRRTVVVVRDAYLAMGRTEAEALAAAERLWRSSKGGAEEVERAIGPIEEALNFVRQKSEETGLSFEELRAQGMLAAADVSMEFAETEAGVLSIAAAGESVARRLGDSIGRLNFDIPVNFRVGDLDLPDIVPMAAGGAGVVTRPTLFLAGEAGPEEFAFSGAGRRFGDAAPGGQKLDRLLQFLERDRREAPQRTASAVRDALLLAGVR